MKHFDRFAPIALLAILVLGALGALYSEVTVNARPQHAPSPRAVPSRPETPLYSLNGRILRQDEPFLASRTAPDGRIIAYRKTEADIALLVEALKEDGVTDSRLLDPKIWLLFSCKRVGIKSCAGNCGSLTCSFTKAGTEAYKVAAGRLSKEWEPLGYCNCR